MKKSQTNLGHLLLVIVICQTVSLFYLSNNSPFYRAIIRTCLNGTTDCEKGWPYIVLTRKYSFKPPQCLG